jgi:putative endonuclease
MSKELNVSTGKLGEEIAKGYLIKKGYKIIEQNFKTKYGEIDLICLKAKELVVVEVRTKVGDYFGSPEESLTKKKLRKLWLNARNYAAKIKWQGEIKIDAVCIVLDSDKSLKSINYYKNII